jgi:hypothetical protein
MPSWRCNVPASDPVHKATIIPRGRALGMVMQLPEGDRYSMSTIQMISRLAIMMGGRVAEETDLRQREGHLRRIVRHRAGDQAGPGHGHPVGHSDKLGQVPMAKTSRRCSSAIRWRSRRTFPKTPPRRSTKPKAKPGSSVPVTKKKKGDEGSGEMEPQPQA